jgi:membrane-associated protein
VFNITHIIQSSSAIFSLLLIGGIIFTESGIPVGFFLPGDTMLFSAGFFASQHYIPLGWLLIVVVVAKVLGGAVGYLIGKKTGPRLFNRKDSFFFRKDYLDSAESFYEKHGAKTIVLGQFIPVIRTFAPIVAGIGKMNKKRFYFFNFIGAVLWALITVLLGFWIGHRVHNIDKYLLPIVIAAMIFSFAPAGWHLFGKKENRQQIIKSVKKKVSRKS